MEFVFLPAFIAGVIGGAIMFGMRLVMKKVVRMDLKMDVACMWGTMIGLQGLTARIAGIAIHLIGSGIIALAYAWGFEYIFGAQDTLWLWGLLGGIILWVLAGLFMGIVPLIHPEIPEQRPAPGVFLKNFGLPDVPTFLMGHLLYGIVVGIVYALLHPNGGSGAAF